MVATSSLPCRIARWIFTSRREVEDFRAPHRRLRRDATISRSRPIAAAYDAHENIAPRPVLETLRAKARAEGLWCLQLKPETGGQGLGKVGMAVCYEAMNRSIFGPVVFNSAAPDDGNMMVLEAHGHARRRRSAG